MNSIFDMKNKRSQRGALLLEIILAVALFSLGMVTMAMMYFAFLSGSRMGAYRPHTDRLQMEVLSRALDEDFQVYRPIFAYEGEVQDSKGWITANEIILNDGVKPYDLQQEDFVKTSPSDTAQTELLLSANTDTRRAYTLIMLGSRTDMVSSNRYKVYADVVYQLIMRNDPSSGTVQRIIYDITRSQIDFKNGKSGFTHRVSFTAEGFSLPNKSDQVLLPAFTYQGGGRISVSLPNPFSKRAVNSVTSNMFYFTPQALEYHLTTTGLYVAP